jgi:hypothetical protein
VLERFQNLEVDGEAPGERVELKKVTLRKKPGAPAPEVQRNHHGLHPQASGYAGRRQ